MIEQLIITIVGVVLTAYCGGLQLKMRKIEQELEDKISKLEVRELLQDKLEVYDVRVQEIKEDLITINHKLDRLIEK